MTDKELLVGIEHFDIESERALSPADRILSEVVHLHRIENSSLVDKDVKQLLGGIRARLMLVQQDIREGVSK